MVWKCILCAYFNLFSTEITNKNSWRRAVEKLRNKMALSGSHTNTPTPIQATADQNTHHPPPTACVCMCALHNQLTFRWCLFLSLNPTLFQSQFAAKGFAGYHSHDTRVLNSFAIRTMCMANWQLQFSCQLSATKMDSTHWQYANDCMAQHYGTFARCRHIRVASSSTIPH